MAESRAVHECLFCPQRFGSAADKDDHVLEHFAQEICVDCDQNLIRIGGKLYVLHDATTCLKREVKFKFENLDYLDDEIKIEDEPMPDSPEQLQNESYEEEMIEMKPDITQIWQHDTIAVENVDLQPNHSQFGVSNLESISFWCDLCGKTLGSKYAVKRHKKFFHSAPGTSLCKCCGKIFSNSEQLATHKPDCLMKKRARVEKKSAKFECDTCKMVFESKNVLQIHMRKHDPAYRSRRVKSVACQICGKVLGSKSALQKHSILLHSAPGTLFCNICTKLFSDQDGLDEHRPVCASRKSDRMKKRVKCQTCGKTVGPTSIRSHNLLCHGLSDTIVCRICRKIFSTQEQLQDHQTDHECDSKGINCFQCYVCEMEFKSGDRLRRHMRKKHVPIEKVVCDICGLVVHPNALQTHMGSMHESASEYFKCNMCSSTFRSSKGITDHKRRKHDPNFRQFECDFCGKRFNYTHTLQNHKILAHSPPGTIFCSICARIYSTEAELIKHKIECDKKKKEHITRSLRVRDCPICGAGIKGKSNLNAHIKTVHERKPRRQKSK